MGYFSIPFSTDFCWKTAYLCIFTLYTNTLPIQLLILMFLIESLGVTRYTKWYNNIIKYWRVVLNIFTLLFFFFNFIYLFIYLFMAVLGLCFCTRAFSSCGKWGPLFIAVRGPLTITASLVAEHRLQTRRLSNCGSQA